MTATDADPSRPVADDPLVQPVYLGGLILTNSTALAPMTRVSAHEHGAVNDRVARYYERFAHGGFGLIITEGIYTDTAYSQGYLHQPGLITNEHAHSWRTVVDAVHEAGAPIIAQLMHAGSHSQGNRHRTVTAGPSAVTPRGQQLGMYRGEGPFATPRAMDRDDIDEARRGFVAAARLATAAGFDGVEIHGANGYLLDQFLTDYLNRRDDEYGGNLKNRVRLMTEVCDEVLEAVGSHAVVGIRISQAKVSDAEHRWAGGDHDAEKIFAAVGATGVHYIHTAEHDALAPAEPGGAISLAALAKRHGGTTVIANGQLGDPNRARLALSSGDVNVVALAKPALADRDWPKATQQGRSPLTELHTDQFGPLADIKDFELES